MTQAPEMEALVLLKDEIVRQTYITSSHYKGLCPLVWDLYTYDRITKEGTLFLEDLIEQRFNEISEVYTYDYGNLDENGNTVVITMDKWKAINEDYEPFYYWNPNDWQARLDFVNEKLKQYEN